MCELESYLRKFLCLSGISLFFIFLVLVFLGVVWVTLKDVESGFDFIFCRWKLWFALGFVDFGLGIEVGFVFFTSFRFLGRYSLEEG